MMLGVGRRFQLLGALQRRLSQNTEMTNVGGKCWVYKLNDRVTKTFLVGSNSWLRLSWFWEPGK